MTTTPVPAPGHAQRRLSAGADVRLAVVVVLLGLPVGGLWRMLAERAVASSSAAEGGAAVDSVLALLQLAVGLLVGVLVLVRPGDQPVRRFALVVVGLLVGGALAWGTGLVLGVRTLGLVAAAFLAAPVASLAVFLATLARYLTDPWAGPGR